MIDVNRKGEVWVFAEQHNGKLSDIPLELMSKARRLADTLKVKLGAVLLGDKVSELAPGSFNMAQTRYICSNTRCLSITRRTAMQRRFTI